MTIDNLKLRTKTLIPLALMALTVVGMVAFGAMRLNSVSQSASDIIEERDVAAVKLTRAKNSVLRIPQAIEALILVDETTPMGKAAVKNYAEAPQMAMKLIEEAAAALPEHAADLTALRDEVKDMGEKSKSVFDLAEKTAGAELGRALKPEELDAIGQASKTVKVFDDGARKLIDDISASIDKLVAENAAAAKDMRAASHDAMLMLIVAGLVSTAIAVAFSIWLTGAKVERPLVKLAALMRRLAGGDLMVEIEGAERLDEVGEMAKAVEVFKTQGLERVRMEQEAATARQAADAERNRSSAERARAAEAQAAAMNALKSGLKQLADGDLATRLEQGFAAEYAEVRDDFNAAAAKLKAALAAVAASTGAIHSSTREISSASDNLSQRTEQQAASLEETAAALEEITTTVKNSAQGAKHAAEVAATADANAKNGAVVVRKAVQAMDAIAESSQKIGQIIGVIDEIAFQTNLLALNAGVEAARAGDSGKGFAVVASEVRALAQRSAEAAREIKTLVSASGAQVQDGVQLVAESGKTLESIITQVSEINHVVAEIANGAQQQATGLQQINTAISQMDQSTQQNATMVEESTAASHSLSQEMTELTKLVEQFRVGDPSEERVRRDLKTVAPHVFAKPAAPQPARAASRAAAKPVAARPAARAAVVGNAAVETDWSEF